MVEMLRGLGRAIYWHYDGMSQNVIAVRQSPWGEGSPKGGPEIYLGERFVSTITYGPLGMISRTEEMFDADPNNNRDHYYISDLQGGNVGVMSDSGGQSIPTRPAFHTFDAFGAPVTQTLQDTDHYAWRGQEGSESNTKTGIVHMQAREYEPGIGRFIQADSRPMGGMTSQG